MTSPTAPAVPKKWIDVLKGIGIISVVAGHAYPWQSGMIVPLIFLFHMPLFFFLSGYLYKPSADLIDYATKKAFHLLVPYAAFLLLLYFLPEICRILATQDDLYREVKYLVKNTVFGGPRLIGFGTAFWFVTCLFFTQQIFNFLVVRFSSGALLSAVVVATVLSFVNSLVYPNFDFPLSINVVLAALPIFYIGYVFKRYEGARWITPVALLVSVLAIVSVLAGAHNFYDMKSSNYGIPVVTMVSAIAVTVVLVAAAKQLQSVPLAATGLIALGQASMVIMFVHQAILIVSRDLGFANPLYGIVLALAVSYGLYLLFKRYTISRAMLLGSESDFRKLVGWRKPGTTLHPLSP